MRRSGLILSRKFVIGILLWTTLLTNGLEALRGSAVVLQAKTKAAEQKETDEETNNGPTANVTKPQLTGIPQIDYVLDPNLPRELNGHNLTDYPFYNSLPEEIDFKCDGLHDGFYASVPHKCQVYHHCLYGTRFDFLCANYTAFDQKTFICHFVSEVDCDNSPKYYKRNEALYKEATTASTTTSTTTTTTTAAPSTTTAANQPAGSRHRNGPPRRRPYRRRRPMYEYYYDDEEYADADYYDDEVASLGHRRTPYRKHNKESAPSETRDTEADYDSQNEQSKPPPVRPSTSGSNGGAASVYERPRTPPKIRRPVPKSERDKYDYAPKQQSTQSTTVSTTTTEKPSPATGKKMANQAPEEEYYEDEEEYDYEEPKPPVKSKPQADYDFPTGYEDTRRYTNRYRGRMPARKRAEMYDDYDVKERPSRINRRKEYNTRYEGERPRNARPMAHREKNTRYEEEPYRYAQPMSGSGYKKRVQESEHRSGTGRRVQEPKRPSVEDDYYYEEEEPEEAPPKRNRRPNQKLYEKAKPVSKQNQQVKERPQEEPIRSEEAPLKYAKGFANTPRNSKANAAENEVPKVSPIYNEISTTETVNIRLTSSQNQKYPNTVKAVKIVNNSLKDEIDDSSDTYAHTEAETKMSSTQMKPMAETPPPRYSNVVSLKTLSPQSHRSSDIYAEGPRKEKKPIEYDERSVPNKTITPVRHFVVSPPRKPSHFASPSAHVNNNYRDDATPSRHSEEKPILKLPDAVQKPITTNEYYKPLQYANHNVSLYPGANYRNYVIPVSHEQPKPNNIRPVKEEHLAPETLNAITNNNYFSTGFISEPKPFTNEALKSTSQAQQSYRQEHRLYTGGDRLYTTNSISFPPHPPSNYDITAPGPSAPGEEPTAPEKKYSDPPTYPASSSADYDVTYNDALQPSTLHPVRRYPSTSFYQQNTQHQQHHQPQQRAAVPNRSPSDFTFNESAFNSLSRSQSRYKK